MSTKQTMPGRARRREAATVAAKAKAGTALRVVRVSFSVDPLVAIVQRHVKISERARQAIARDLTDALEHASVDMDVRQPPVEAEDPVLTTEEAAQLLKVSRPFVVKLIDTGAVALDKKVGNQRRVRRSAVLHWQQSERLRQAKSLRRLAKDLDEEIFPS
mgnify:CR=1 FL=1